MSIKFIGYRLCVFASGSLITDKWNCLMLTIVSCLHFVQNSGKFSRTVSSRIFNLVFFRIGGIISILPYSCPAPFPSAFIFSFVFRIPAFTCCQGVSFRAVVVFAARVTIPVSNTLCPFAGAVCIFHILFPQSAGLISSFSIPGVCQ